MVDYFNIIREATKLAEVCKLLKVWAWHVCTELPCGEKMPFVAKLK